MNVRERSAPCTIDTAAGPPRGLSSLADYPPDGTSLGMNMKVRSRDGACWVPTELKPQDRFAMIDDSDLEFRTRD
ncbi:hypothetical protein GCM10027298_23960 [Epidermidibacterium keratini]